MEILKDDKHNGHRIFLYDDGTPILLPCLFARSTMNSHLVYVQKFSKNKRTKMLDTKLVHKDITTITVEKYLYHLGKFLSWIDSDENEYPSLTLEFHTACPDDLLTKYINDIVIVKNEGSQQTVDETLSALHAYYNWLAFAGLGKFKSLFIQPDLKSVARDNVNRRKVIKYLTPELREAMYRAAPTRRDELILRTGGELGLRSKENVGLILNDFTANKKKYEGLLSLFKKAESDKDIEEFTYYLQDKFVKAQRFKGGVGRELIIPRNLLMMMKNYHTNDRPSSDSNHLFLTNSSDGVHLIRNGFATDTFKNVRIIVIDKQKNGMLYDDMQALEDSY